MTFINNFERFKNKVLVLAPMAGITDLAFRNICKVFGADRLYTEMISVDALFYKNDKTRDLLLTNDEDRPLVVQIFGKTPKLFYEAAKFIREHSLKKPDGIDINFGCPARKVVNNGGGVKLMLNPKLSREIISATILGAGDLPVSIKIRSGIADMTAEKFIEELKDLPWKSLIVHVRPYEEAFTAKPDWTLVKRLKDIVPDREIIVNGGIYSPEDAVKALEESEADGIALAQGVLGRPWLFAQIKDYFKTGKYSKIYIHELKRIIEAHATLMERFKGEKGIIEFRKHLAWYLKGVENASKYRALAVNIQSLVDVSNILSSLPDNILLNK